MKPRINRKTAVIMIVAGDLLLLVLGWVLLVSPQRQTASTIARATQAAEAQIIEAQQAAQPPAAAAKQPTIATAALYQLDQAMPSTTDMPDVLLELDQVARAAGVTINSISPGPISPNNNFGVVPINITFAGNFYSLTDLLYRLRALVSVRNGELEATGRLFAVDSVALAPTGVGTGLTAAVTLDTYVYGVPDPALEAAAAAAQETGTGTSSTSTSTTSGSTG
jgi:Tfp pilus assembly protein PilO